MGVDRTCGQRDTFLLIEEGQYGCQEGMTPIKMREDDSFNKNIQQCKQKERSKRENVVDKEMAEFGCIPDCELSMVAVAG